MKIEASKRVLKVAVAVLMLALVGASYATYHLWTTKQVSNNARISTVLNLGLYNDSSLQFPLTSIDWGDFGAGGKDVKIYFKNLGNDVGYLTWNLTTQGWTLKTHGDSVYNYWYYYTNGNFNFSICGGDSSPDLSVRMNPEDSYDPYPEVTYLSLQSGEVGHLWLRCWTEKTTPCQSNWNIHLNLYDNLS